MAQLSLYLDDDTMERLRRRAEERHTSLSKYVSDLVRRDLGSGWPPGFLDLYGSIDDDAFVEPDEIPFELDAPRPWDDPSWQGLVPDEGGGQLPDDQPLDDAAGQSPHGSDGQPMEGPLPDGRTDVDGEDA